MKGRFTIICAGFLLTLCGACNAEGANAVVSDFSHQSEQASQVLNALQEHGADLSKPRNVVHYFYDGDFQGLGDALKKLGYRTRPTVDDDGVIAERADILNEEWRLGTLTQLSEMANQYGCEYDGWEAAMTPETEQ